MADSNSSMNKNIDPSWAWSPFEPDSDQPWDVGKATHLFRRAGVGADATTISAALKSTPAELVRDLISKHTESTEFSATADTLARTILRGGDPKQLSAAWVYRLLHSPNQLLEKMVVFWHGHFATGADKVKNVEMMWAQNRLLREHALGEFEPLVQAIARDPAMLVYLDSATNRKAHPNENFARELMELFCLGEGNYTESDVQQLARCFTGWEIKNDRFRKNSYQQDTSPKTFLGQRGSFDGEDGIRIVLEQPEMPLFICRKLYRFFVADEPAPADGVIAPLANLFRESDLNVAPVIERMLSSNLFFSPHAYGRKIRSPLELGVGMLRALEASTNTLMLANELRQIGQGLFFPPNVKGWDGGRAWINSSTLLGRANLVQRVLSDDATRFAGGTLDSYLRSQHVAADKDVVPWLTQLLLAVPLQPSIAEQLSRQLASSSGDRESRLRSVLHSFTTLPEFQLA